MKFFKSSRKTTKSTSSYKNETAIPVQFYINENGETCFRETIGRDGRVIRRR